MKRSSSSIASLAAALAKAQAELLNPEKPSSARFDLMAQREKQSFRYASLASGLDIARKMLGDRPGGG